MKKTFASVLGVVLAAPFFLAPLPALADDAAQGPWQVKLLGTAVLPTGSVKSVKNDTAGLVAAGDVTNTTASDNVVPTVAIEYFFTKNISLETICCVTGHHVTISQGALAGTVAVDNVQIIPATFTAKYHLPLGPIVPYVGVGPTLFIVLNDRPSAAVQAAGVTRTKLSSEFGLALQGGFDVPLGHGFGLAFDAKKYWVSTNATFYDPAAPGGVALETRNKLDPWVLSSGVSYRF